MRRRAPSPRRALQDLPRRAARAAPTPSARRSRRRGRSTRARRRSADPRPSRRPRSGEPRSHTTARRPGGSSPASPIAIRAGTAAPVPYTWLIPQRPNHDPSSSCCANSHFSARPSRLAVGAAHRREHLQRVRGHVGARLVDHLAEVQERAAPSPAPACCRRRTPPSPHPCTACPPPTARAVDRLPRACTLSLLALRPAASGAPQLAGLDGLAAAPAPPPRCRRRRGSCRWRTQTPTPPAATRARHRPVAAHPHLLLQQPPRRAAAAPGARAATPASLSATIASAVSHTGDWHASRRRLAPAGATGGRDGRGGVPSPRSSTMKRSSPSRPRRITG